MGSVYQPYLHNRNLDNIPPRQRYLSAQTSNMHENLLYNDTEFDDEIDLYSSDNFRMYDYKIQNCSRNWSHDWKDCPFAHPGEIARRRDPRIHSYSSYICPEFRLEGRCRKGDKCEYSHGVFETWLHPSRYRTEECKDGIECVRKICFFAHTLRQLRDVPESSTTTTLNGRANIVQKSALVEFNRLYDAMNLNKASNNGESVSFNANDKGKGIVISDPPQFNRAPGAPSTSKSNPFVEEKYENDDGFVGPDFGWVNDLLT